MSARRLAAVVALALTATGLVACAPDAGYVTAHPHHNSWTEQVCYSRNKYGICTFEQPVHHDEEWCLTLRGEGKDDGDTGDQCFNDATIWERYPVGVHYPDAR
jgi:hypothetical protein